jgi:aminoglycoside phosphotransferase (APT) family kinase protein
LSYAQAIASYLSKRLPDAHDLTVTKLYRIPGGASRETWSVDARWTDAESRVQTRGFIIRRDPPASLLDSDRELEFAFYQSFTKTSVPVPQPLWLETDPGLLERPFFVMERIDGCNSQFQLIADPSFDPHREGLGRRAYEILAEISSTPIEDLPARKVVDVPRPEDCWQRELEHWEKIIDANELEPQPIARAGIRWLRRNPPPPAQRVSVVHGDFRTGNFLFRGAEIFGVLDWEMAHFGDPLEDLAWSFMQAWHWTRDGRVGGVLQREDAIRIWEEKSGLCADPEALHWWDVFSCIKAQGIWLTGAKEFAEGRATDLLFAFTSYWLMNSQDKFLLEVMGRL